MSLRHPSEHLKSKSSQISLHKVSSRICAKYDKVYEDGPNSKRVVYIRKKANESKYDTKSISPSICGFLRDCTEAIVMDEGKRLRAGKASLKIVNVIPSLTICNSKNTVGAIIAEPDMAEPNVVHVELNAPPMNPNWVRQLKCTYTGKTKRPRKMNRGTQTLFRESSAQTLPFLPEVLNDKETLKTLELFNLPKILKGDGPPGLYEVEILERARKRWAFEKSIKKEFECQMKAARTKLERRKQLLKHKTVMEAFEWEHWLQREEAIQSYQMMRFDLVLRIFEKREREMHQASNARIEKSCEQITAKRDEALKKNEIEYGRQMRRLKSKHERKPRNWRKEKISDQLGDPSSEYYAPQMRYGVNPNRRHFQLSRKAFEMRMEDLEKRSVNMKNLECPFAKLKEWSKPKEQKPEVEQNFTTDTNLKKLYESLKGLREQSKKQKMIPKCLKEKAKEQERQFEISTDNTVVESFEYEDEGISNLDTGDEAVQVGVSFSRNSLTEMYSQRDSNVLSIAELLDERRREELEGLLAEYEGTTIGWLMRFLSEEMGRLQEQRKLHFITMLAQKERWRREAAEAGLRQKENEMRRIYEEIFDDTDTANAEVCEQYLDNIFGIDTREQADYEAISNITALARVIDTDLQRWLISFKTIQNPLNYDDLRCLLRDLVFPDNIVDCLVQEYESHLVVDYVMNDVLFPNIYELLEPFDVSSKILNDLVDRLTDNDLYFFSSEVSSCCDCYGVCHCGEPELEAKAIMRKIIRRSVPGRRWRTQTERFADENINDIIDSVCTKIKQKKSDSPKSSRRPTITKVPSNYNLMATRTTSEIPHHMYTTSTDSLSGHTTIDTITIIKYRKDRGNHDSVTGSFSNQTKPVVLDPVATETFDSSASSVLIDYKTLQSVQNSSIDMQRTSFLRKVSSSLDIRSVLSKPPYTNVHTEESSTDTELELLTRAHKYTNRVFINNLLNTILNNIVPAESGDDDFETESLTSEDDIEIEKSKEDSRETDQESHKSFTHEIDHVLKRVAYHIEDRIQASTSFETERTIRFEGLGEDLNETSYRAYGETVKTTSDYEMVMYEKELNDILNDDECKCQMEIDYQNKIRQLYESGKIQIIRQTLPSLESYSEKDQQLMEMVFEYNSSWSDIQTIDSSDKIAESEYEDTEEHIYDGEESKEDKTLTEHENLEIVTEKSAEVVEATDAANDFEVTTEIPKDPTEEGGPIEQSNQEVGIADEKVTEAPAET